MPPTAAGSEHDVQSRFFALVRQVLAQMPEDHAYQMATWATPNGFLRSKTMRIRAWREGCLSGVSDVVVVVAHPPFNGLFLEFKTPKGVMSPEQRRFKRAMEKLGYRHEEVRTAEDAFRIWCEHLRIQVEMA